MRIKMLASVTGPNGKAYGQGQEFDAPDEWARVQCQCGNAMPVKGKVVERAVIEPEVETTAAEPKPARVKRARKPKA